MAKNRNGNFSVTIRYVEKARPNAKRVDVLEATLTRSCSGAAYKLALDTQTKAAQSWSIMLVNIIIREDGKVVWKLL